ncbi:MAG: hypothetical protein EOO02_23960 [Chitinophagaceae bacterium]|nr:MAG: hypothetical protein EOO02_23960 [Chitinophagaceae bacterium]
MTVQEVHELYDHPFSEKNLSNIRDLFVFICLTGLRWEDVRQFDARFIFPSADGAGKVYKKKAYKTRSSSGKTFEIPLCDIALEILKKHGGSLKPLMVSNVEANRRVKDALEETGRFHTITEIKDKHTGEYLRRFEAVTMHKGRDSFISNLVDITPLNELMKYTAHSKLSTLQGYLDRNRPVSMNYITKTFNRH